MKRMLAILITGALLQLTANGGSIAGTVRAEPRPGAQDAAADGKYSSRKYKFVERINYAELRDFVVHIEGPVAGAPKPPDRLVTVNTRRVTQTGAMFTPHVLPVMAGTRVEWPNNDDIFHNVFSMSDAKQFDLELYKGNPPDKQVLFDKAGRVDVFCSIHANMHCIVLVLENPYFAVSDDRGHFSITNVPPGTYKLRAWHERVPAQVKEITVPADGAVEMNFVLGVGLPKN